MHFVLFYRRDTKQYKQQRQQTLLYLYVSAANETKNDGDDSAMFTQSTQSRALHKVYILFFQCR